MRDQIIELLRNVKWQRRQDYERLLKLKKEYIDDQIYDHQCRIEKTEKDIVPSYDINDYKITKYKDEYDGGYRSIYVSKTYIYFQHVKSGKRFCTDTTYGEDYARKHAKDIVQGHLNFRKTQDLEDLEFIKKWKERIPILSKVYYYVYGANIDRAKNIEIYFHNIAISITRNCYDYEYILEIENVEKMNIVKAPEVKGLTNQEAFQIISVFNKRF